MPIYVETDFCKNGFNFAHERQKNGTLTSCFSPSTVWYGVCKNKQPHTQACQHFFHKRKFTLPTHVCLKIIENLPRKLMTEYIKNSIYCPADLVVFSQIESNQAAATQWFESMIRTRKTIAADVLRALCRHAVVSRQALCIAKKKLSGGTAVDKLCISIYCDYIFKKVCMPMDFHPPTLRTAKTVFIKFKLPEELHSIICAFIFKPIQGLPC